MRPADAAGTPQDAEAEALLAKAGVPQAQIEAGRAIRGADSDAPDLAPMVWLCHVDACRLFKALMRQWRMHVGPQGAVLYQGLDLAALDGVRRMLRIKPSAELMDQLNVMETAGAKALNNLQG